MNIQALEQQHNIRILYVAKSGSQLYGTATDASDTDYKGVYLPSKQDRLLGSDKDYIKLDTNKSNTANSASDIDFHLDSVHKFFGLISKGETNAIDTLFSMWSDSIVYADPSFIDFCKSNYLSIITSKPNAFTGYAVSQAKMYDVKGQRFNELVAFTNTLNSNKHIVPADKLGDYQPHITELIAPYSYINYIQAPGPRGIEENWTYLEVLGKKFSPTVSIEYLIDKLQDMEHQFGQRARKAADNIDWKALSHAVRVSQEIVELLQTNFIKFPLRDRSYILDIKQGKVNSEVVINTLAHNISLADELIKTTTLNPETDYDLLNKYILTLYGE